MELTNTIITAGATITALGVILALLRATYKFARKIEKALGEDSQGRSISERLNRVEHQVYPNGGGSLSDKVNDIEKTLISIQTKTNTIETMVSSIIESNATSNNIKRPGSSPREPKPTAKKTKTPTKTG